MRNDPTFYLKFLLPVVALVITYVILEQSYMATLSENDLVPVSSKVISIKQGKYKHGRSLRDRITIVLDKPDSQCYFMENNQDLFPTIMNKIQIGDLITVYHRTKMQAKVGLGNEFEILKIQKEAENVYSLEMAKQNFRSLRNYLVVPALALWIFYLYFRNKMKRNRSI